MIFHTGHDSMRRAIKKPLPGGGSGFSIFSATRPNNAGRFVLEPNEGGAGNIPIVYLFSLG
jgi:hypothetical protein